ncbi:CLM9 protein, partial [Oriolus oriolus]|nr:CLM9 protein [Oriolus oriolus]
LQGQTPDAERRREGDTLYVRCPYTAQIADQQIPIWYWCRLVGQTCQELAWTYSQQRLQSADRKITIEDDGTSKTVSVTVTDLKAEDSGTYFCAYRASGYVPLRTISLNVFRGSSPKVASPPPAPALTLIPKEEAECSDMNSFLILSMVLLILLIVAVVTSITLCVKYSKLLERTGNREAEDTSDRAEGTAQPGSTGRRESSQDDSKGPAYINLDLQSQPSPEDPLYCNVEPSQAHRNPQDVEYAIIAFNQSPGSGRE